MGGGGRYPYPKFVWSPAGGWWSQPANWKMNTFIASCGIAFTCAAIIRAVAHREVGIRRNCFVLPSHSVLSSRPSWQASRCRGDDSPQSGETHFRKESRRRTRRRTVARNIDSIAAHVLRSCCTTRFLKEKRIIWCPPSPVLVENML
ncbi:hypothetical protein FB45DRAFT_182836 [Roridomyces roridus]|uniref:Uncharacterized protein n=1 Tax=Roridomyces roridus TaxID=1738132 RepID=A0AAD7CEN5_9AGAR|nr:hypothetical protein FB45DRAFT_182836 [Roridomyces roridus]